MMNLPYPNVSNGTPEQQVQQLKRYLYQLVDQLNYQLKQLEKNNKEG